MKKSKKQQQMDEAAKCLQDLRPDITNGVQFYGILRYVSTNGMSRRIDILIVDNNRPITLLYNYQISGCGMDMGFALASELFNAAYPNTSYCNKMHFSWL